MKPSSVQSPFDLSRWVEFMAVGGLTFLILPALTLGRLWVGVDATELAIGFLMFHAAWVVNDPHFAATYVLFYGKARQRLFPIGGLPKGSLPKPNRAAQLGNWLAGVVVPFGLVSWAGVSLLWRSQATLGGLIQLMFLLVGWHYAKQGFGVFLALSVRRGVQYSSAERKVVLWHCHAGWLYAWASPVDPGTASVVHGVYYRSLPHPAGLERLTAGTFALTAVGVIWMLWRKWQREGCLPPVSALCGLFVSIWAWMVFSRIEPLFYYAIPFLHSLQYLFFVWLLRRNEAEKLESQFRGTTGQRLGLLAVTSIGLGWVLLKGAPAFCDDVFAFAIPTGRTLPPMGPTPYLAAFVGIVNIHHYAMDAVIWRRSSLK